MINIFLKEKREKQILAGNPWIYSGSIQKVEGKPEDGELCKVFSFKNEELGTGFYNSKSAIAVRMLTKKGQSFDEKILSERIFNAIIKRKNIIEENTDSFRLINSEGDLLPGLIADKYDNGICIQIQTAGMERFRKYIVESLIKYCNPDFIFEKSDTEACKREGLILKKELVYGKIDKQIIATENNLKFNIDLTLGQKTGFYLDQRCNRKLFAFYARGKRICDCFCYSGGFSVYGLTNGAISSSLIDISQNALDLAKKNILLNNIAENKCNFVKSDAFEYLRKSKDMKFDCIVLDPPKFAKSKADIHTASRGYKDINMLAIKNIASSGIIFTFSCSNAIDVNLFRQIIFAAATDSKRDVQVIHVLSAGPDHPFLISHKEGEYLKGIVIRVL
jgi:23S rRNA (cytosine1962-C5)-methyltransferase